MFIVSCGPVLFQCFNPPPHFFPFLLGWRRAFREVIHLNCIVTAISANHCLFLHAESPSTAIIQYYRRGFTVDCCKVLEALFSAVVCVRLRLAYCEGASKVYIVVGWGSMKTVDAGVYDMKVQIKHSGCNKRIYILFVESNPCHAMIATSINGNAR
eukprot:scaffold118270_cov42-Prasinocladus_malaysianus.AAC.1